MSLEDSGAPIMPSFASSSRGEIQIRLRRGDYGHGDSSAGSSVLPHRLPSSDNVTRHRADTRRGGAEWRKGTATANSTGETAHDRETFSLAVHRGTTFLKAQGRSMVGGLLLKMDTLEVCVCWCF
ncbi:hypothetical protein NQZ68_002851 [Dissostichus eleginoides]|nr:hypothetical protein NQZ68_002851 [Dissostichus eleginoides]